MNNSTSNETFCITNKEGWYVPGYWSPDNKKLNCTQITTLTDYDIWLLDIKNNELVQITPLKGIAEKSRFIVELLVVENQIRTKLDLRLLVLHQVVGFKLMMHASFRE